MTLFEAVAIVEDEEEAGNAETVLAAWQYLHDSGAAYTLQGWYGRTAQHLLQQGLIR